ncbi:MAG TPA: cation:proton antiporter [Burkholderiales bacterium]|nr:cation:proton antiporter [Burkholderiales bacterium]
MHAVGIALQPIVILLAAAVLAVVACRLLSLPPIIGYLAVGLALGPRALGAAPDDEQLRDLAEFGVVFLMFSIGLEFSLPKLRVMQRDVFGLGLAQVAITIAACVALALAVGGAAGVDWRTGLALGGAVAMSSTAVVSKLLVERMELESAHGRAIIGVLLAQDLAVVPLLILVPVLGEPAAGIGLAIGVALAKAAFVLAVLLLAGPRIMRAWFGVVARRKSTELFVLNVLLVVLTLALVTGLAGLSLALGAFLAGMLISETEYRYQVEEEIKPFRDVLLGVFFVTVGMLLDLRLVMERFGLVLALLAALVAFKFALIGVLARLAGKPPGAALRTALALAQGGEFGFVLLAQANAAGAVPDAVAQPLLAAMILSMMATPFLVGASDRLVLRFAQSEWMQRSLELHRVAVQSLETERHVIILGYGRNGQHVARLLDAEGVRYMALDLDPERVREAALAGDTVVFADCARREALLAAGVMRAAAVVVTFAESAGAVRVLAHIQALNPTVPVIARAREDADIARLSAAGASEIVPEALESGLMLASHTLMWVGVPLNRVVRRVRAVRDEQYGLLRGLFHGATDEADHADAAQPRLHAVTLPAGAEAVGRALDELALDELAVQVRSVRRQAAGRRLGAGEAGPLQAGDVVVMLGIPEALAAAEARLLRG